MIYVITGAVNSGKTTKLASLYQLMQSGDGFILPTLIEDGLYKGQDLIRLSSNVRIPFSRLRDHRPDNWDESICCGLYSISKTGLSFAQRILEEAFIERVSPVFMDELGSKELEECLFEAFKKCLHSASDTYFTACDTRLLEVMKSLNISSCHLIRL